MLYKLIIKFHIKYFIIINSSCVSSILEISCNQALLKSQASLINVYDHVLSPETVLVEGPALESLDHEVSSLGWHQRLIVEC